MQIYVINLDKRPDRLAYMEKQLKDNHLSFKRVSAYDGSQLKEGDDAFIHHRYFYLRWKRKISAGEVGCAISHRNIWKKMLDENIDYALILEDDVAVDSRLKQFIEQKDYYQKFDFLNLGNYQPFMSDNAAFKDNLLNKQFTRPHNKKRLINWQKIEWQSWKIYSFRETEQGVYTMESSTVGELASGYILSRNAAKSFLKASDHAFYPIDHVWQYMTDNLSLGFTFPSLVKQVLQDSNISDRQSGQLSLMDNLSRFFFNNTVVKKIRLKRKLNMIDKLRDL